MAYPMTSSREQRTKKRSNAQCLDAAWRQRPRVAKNDTASFLRNASPIMGDRQTAPVMGEWPPAIHWS